MCVCVGGVCERCIFKTEERGPFMPAGGEGGGSLGHLPFCLLQL